eukprot:5156606-Amphidinium_carterae.1
MSRLWIRAHVRAAWRQFCASNERLWPAVSSSSAQIWRTLSRGYQLGPRCKCMDVTSQLEVVGSTHQSSRCAQMPPPRK